MRISTSVAKHEISPPGISHVARKTPYLQNRQAIPQLFNYIKYTTASNGIMVMKDEMRKMYRNYQLISRLQFTTNKVML
jgi:hypothetical protein